MIRLRELRQAQGWTQAQLGKRVGLAKTTISGYEKEDHQLDPTTIHVLCDLFGCTSDYLLGRSDTQLPAMTDEEARLLSAYKKAPDNIKASIRLQLNLENSESKKDTAAS